MSVVNIPIALDVNYFGNCLFENEPGLRFVLSAIEAQRITDKLIFGGLGFTICLCLTEATGKNRVTYIHIITIRQDM